MAVVITPSTPEGGTLPLFKTITIPGHGHLSRSKEGFYVDICNVPPGITHYEVDLLKSHLVTVGNDGYCKICKGGCPCDGG